MQLNEIEIIRKENHEKWLQKNQERFQQFLMYFKQVRSSVIEYQHTFFEQFTKIEYSEMLQSNLKELQTKATALNMDQDITQSIGRCLSHVNDIIDNVSMPSLSLYQNHTLRISALFEIMLLDLTQSKRLPIDDLPNDISRQIFKLFDMTTLASATSVSKKWYQQGNEEYYWKHKLQGFPNLVQNNNITEKDNYKNIYALAKLLMKMPNYLFVDKARHQIDMLDMCSQFEKIANILTPHDILDLAAIHAKQHPKSVNIFLNSFIINTKLKKFIKKNPTHRLMKIVTNFSPSNQDQADVAITLYLLNPQNLCDLLSIFPDLKVLYARLLDSPEILCIFSSNDLAAFIYHCTYIDKDLHEKFLLTIGGDFKILKALNNSYIYLSEIKKYPDIALTVLKKSGFLYSVQRKIVSSRDLHLFAELSLSCCLAILESPILTEQFETSILSSRLGKHLENLADPEFEIAFEKILESKCIAQLDLFILLTNACTDESRIKQVLDDPCVLNRLSHDQLGILISSFKIQHFAANSIHIQEGRLVSDTEQVDPDNNNAITRIR